MGLGGLVVPVPTLFADDGSLDTGRNAKFARALSEEKVDHLFVLGSLGEFPSVDVAERERLVDTVIESATGTADVWVGVGAPSTAEAIRFADQAEGLGAAALVAVPPYYLRPTEASVERYYRAIAASVSIPLLAYNIPSLVGYGLAPSLVHRLGRERLLRGVKDTSPSITSLAGFLDDRPDGFVVLPGNDRLALEGIRRGADGAVMGLANIAPRLCVELVARARRGEPAEELAAVVDALASVVDAGPFPSSIKYLAQQLRGSEVGYRAPYDPLSEAEVARVAALLAPLEDRLAPYRTR
jgi:dihydrodipicolinate synthase/N-acetylneuraminate lyase